MPPKPLMCSTENLSKDLTGKVCIVTGSTSGIGLEVARQLAKQGATVVKACRNLDAGQALASEIAAATGAPVTAMRLDLGSLQSVRDFANEFEGTHTRLDALINNAGVMNTPEGLTVDGFETQFGVNFLGPFLLTKLLIPLLGASAPSRIINTSSVYHERGDIDFNDLQWEERPYNGFQAYHDSKLAVVMSARRMGQDLADTGVTSVSVHPGWAQSNLVKNTLPLWVQNYALYPVLKLMGMITPWECAQTTLYCVLDEDVPRHNGAYFSQCSTLYKVKADKPGGWPLEPRNPAVSDDEMGARLHDVATKLVGL